MCIRDRFWHAKNVIVRDCIVKGEYLAWYCENVTFENCRIIGTQPLSYCRGLKLINCEMVDCDLAFERSQVAVSYTHLLRGGGSSRLVWQQKNLLSM